MLNEIFENKLSLKISRHTVVSLLDFREVVDHKILVSYVKIGLSAPVIFFYHYTLIVQLYTHKSPNTLHTPSNNYISITILYCFFT